MSWAAIVAVIAITAGAGTVQALTGFGFALLSTPLLAVVVGPREAVVVSVLYGTITATSMSYQFRSTIDRPVLWRMCAGRLVGMPLGVWLLTAVGRDALRLAIALSVLVSAWLLWRGVRLQRRGAAVDVAAGVLSGALTTSVSTGGPPLVLAMQARGMDPDTFRGTMSAVSLYTGAIAVALLAGSGNVSRASLVATVAGAPGLVAGVAAGRALVPRVDAERFRVVVLGLLVVASVIAAGSVLGG
jgi:uncharacterized membrane protein YfcA